MRVDQNDWKDVDYEPAMNEQEKAGSLGNDHISLQDNDDEFAREVANKRGKNVEPAALSEEPGAQRIAKISTVPDSVTGVPVIEPNQSIDSTPAKAKVAGKAAGKPRREKRSGTPPFEKPADQEAETTIQSESAALITRTGTAVVLAAIAVVCFFAGVTPTLIFVAVLVAAMSLELCGAFREMGSKPAGLLVAVMSFFAVIAGYLVGDRAVALSAVTFFVFGALWYLFAVVRARPVIGLAMSALVFVYVGVLGSYAGMILGLEDAKSKSIGIFVLVSTVLCVAANDTTAYLFGKFMGRTPLAPGISPNKTMEGTTAGIIASIIVGMFVGISSSNNIWGGLKGGIALGMLVACASIFGDLVESMLKRDCNLKDFGTILPGHGGLMDRFDGLLFALPVAFYLALALR